ncbi:unnamed protein product [Hyaloperonospora brassicae]|uniref:Uncharacterized protein n=1 Tax=Hyaloperonospora brassicae TaxID=162125 RepID=A0AAV0V5B6_HYABA|nr:unnamed protein product [Hyaloperonospora brassicae]
MSSSYKQKKLKTVATRKKTRKRHRDDGLTVDDDSGRLFQPPRTREPRWKKPSMETVTTSVLRTKRQKKSEKKRRRMATTKRPDDDTTAAGIELVEQDAGFCQDGEAAELHETEESSNAESDATARLFALPKTPLRLCASLEDVVAQAAAKHADIRRKDGRQKTKVLLLVDARSIFKLMKKKLNIRLEMVKPKSRLGVGSAKKPELVYKNTGLVKTPLERFKDVNKTVLTGYKSGKLSSILAEDLSFHPYAGFKVQHVIFVAKEAASVVHLDRDLLRNVALDSFVIYDDKSASDSDNEVLQTLRRNHDVTSA